jgi:hypothetical protein
MRLAMTAVLMTAAVMAAADAAVMTARVFQLRHIPVADAVRAIQPLLSEQGSFMVQPAGARLTVQDRPEVVARVATLIEAIDRAPNEFKIRVDLYLASNESLAEAKQAPVDERVRKMFQYRSYRSVGHARILGLVGDAAGAELGSGYRIVFIVKTADPEVPARTGAAAVRPSSRDEAGERLTLQQLMLLHISEDDAGVERRTQVLRTTMNIAPGQQVILGASRSESADQALILIVHLDKKEEG